METLLFVALVAGALATLVVGVRGRSYKALGVALLLLVGGTWAAIRLVPSTPAAGSAADPANDQRPLKARHGGYVSSDACAACHPAEYASWHDSYHRTMTQVVTPATVLADWNGAFFVSGKTYHLAREDDRFYVEVEPEKGAMRTRQRVLMATGSHLQQVYWIDSGTDREVELLPITWMVEEQRWIPYRFSFLEPDDPTETPFVWNSRCIFCHSTGGQPRFDTASGEVDTTVGELGIACEACHGPGEEHVRANQSPVRRYGRYLTGGNDETIVHPAKLSPERSNEICGHCHGMTGYANNDLVAKAMTVGSTYLPGDDLSETRIPFERPAEDEPNIWGDRVDFDTFTWDDGQIRNSGRDYNGIRDSPCSAGGELSCLSCHSMHHSDPNDQLAEGKDGDEACLQCHEGMRESIPEHTHHPAESSGSRCYNCHMPHTSYGLLKAIRTHTIGKSPSALESLDVRRPNSCNLCHLDRSLGWTAETLEQWYGQPAPTMPGLEDSERSAAVLWLLRGDALQRTLIAWHMGWQPAVETAGAEWIPYYLSYALEDSYSAVRFIAERSLRRIPGYEDAVYDYVGTPASRRATALEVRQRWLATASDRTLELDPSLFLGPGGIPDERLVREVISRRDERIVRIAE